MAFLGYQYSLEDFRLFISERNWERQFCFSDFLASCLTQFYKLRSVRRKTAMCLWQEYSPYQDFVSLLPWDCRGFDSVFWKLWAQLPMILKNGKCVPGESMLWIRTSSGFQSITQHTVQLPNIPQVPLSFNRVTSWIFFYFVQSLLSL